MSDLPPEIALDETIARAMRSPDEVNANTLSMRARSFRPRGASDRISAMRQLIGDSECKARAKLICAQADHGEYAGLATALVSALHEAGAAVVLDETEEYPGHVHIVYSVPGPPDGDPDPDPAAQEALDLMLEMVFAAFVFRKDSSPNEEKWLDATLKISA